MVLGISSFAVNPVKTRNSRYFTGSTVWRYEIFPGKVKKLFNIAGDVESAVYFCTSGRILCRKLPRKL